jgi:heat shock protein HslJ
MFLKLTYYLYAMKGKRLNQQIGLIIILLLAITSCGSKETTTSLYQQTSTATLTNTYWKLNSLQSGAILNNDSKELFVKLNNDNTFRGFAGCNEIWGIFKFRDTQVKFSNINKTKMACEKLPIENSLIDALQKSIGYIIINNELQLIATDGNIIAKFNLIEELKKQPK